MRKRQLAHIISLLFCATLICGCTENKAEKERIKWQVSLNRDDKRPYGTWLAYHSLKYYFPDVPTESLSGGFRYTNIDNKMKYSEGRSLMILTGLNFYVSEKEWQEIKQFVISGNEVLIFCSQLDNKIENELNCYKQGGGEEYYSYYQYNREDNQAALSMNDVIQKKYGYEGHSILGYFTGKEVESERVNTAYKSSTSAKTDSIHFRDSSLQAIIHGAADEKKKEEETDDQSEHTVSSRQIKADTLGYVKSNINFLRYKMGEGHLTIHAAPLVLSNYFLLQQDNREYLTGIWRTLPDNISHIYWNEYYKRHIEDSGLSILFRFPATKYALLLGIFALIMYVLFEGKRKQRVIPIIAPLKNDSVSFVETVGRLYFNKGDHMNLAEKMTQQFLEWVRIHYFLNTNILNDHFTQQLIIKSGQSEATVRGLMEMIHELRMHTAHTDDAYLYQLYNTIQQFYKNDRK